jgi:membrane protein required for colicin V production
VNTALEGFRLGLVDTVMLGVLLLSLIVGVWRGLVFEMLSLAGWVVAWIAAQWFAPSVAPHIPVGEPASSLNLGASYAILFVAVLIVWAILARLVRMLIRATPLSGIDRLLGAGFGLLRGLVLLVAIATVVSLTPLAKSPAWQQSQGAAWLQAMLRGLKPALPPDIARHLPA